MTREQMAQQATDIHKEATRRTEQHFNSMRHYWDHVAEVNPVEYKATRLRVFQFYRREVTGGSSPRAWGTLGLIFKREWVILWLIRPRTCQKKEEDRENHLQKATHEYAITRYPKRLKKAGVLLL